MLRPIWQETQDQVMARFDGLTVDELCDRARGEQIASEAAQVADFII